MHSIKTYIGLGSNQGNSIANIKNATNHIYSIFHKNNCRTSKLYSTTPVDADGPNFTNSVMEIYLTNSPIDLLDQLQKIENKFGRTRPYKNAPRTLDIDILLYGNQIIQSHDLIIPHPRMHERLFVLKPLKDLEPNIELPIYGNINNLIKKIKNQEINTIE
ncbi:2-amino-4-hydroxy-6-hydroxymethyldihydropteridine diphosphokinase [Candidatus Kinetoplastidibacterium crithidiae]|uniref:2-amino-4-hydroxy-6-hydroxymethyldihydropteridine pyrophosphokinase n=1 Tax=Candidatus Kinetoplastidibacterium crithidiae TCC036E TaxID=1208918 RepID=M1L5C9_9PROT|nr:2-amino-4-hydroxy-6-hydroxymethyldihydropteridine diphosphokinase [Candidatus Kinetoplastibacterium crithidii]AGF47843.1 2-amino-4-hydroxy-6-hydroxymethyldihydropteridine pyrophosphokinase [Candidatus Kinetoplastibacterium crithidii TCC036E]